MEAKKAQAERAQAEKALNLTRAQKYEAAPVVEEAGTKEAASESLVVSSGSKAASSSGASPRESFAEVVERLRRTGDFM